MPMRMRGIVNERGCARGGTRYGKWTFNITFLKYQGKFVVNVVKTENSSITLGILGEFLHQRKIG